MNDYFKNLIVIPLEVPFILVQEEVQIGIYLNLMEVH
nr:MAG TPA: hypothetical protein [Bacteriophage sp.]